MVADAISHYLARAEAARLLSEGTSPEAIVECLESRGIAPAEAHDVLHEAQRALSHAPVSDALRSALAGGFWFLGGLGVLLLTYGLGRRVGEDLLVSVVLVYGVAVMAVGLFRAFRVGDDQDRSSVFRLFVMAVILVLAAGGLAVRAYQRQAARIQVMDSIAGHLETIQGFNHLEATLASRLESAGDDVDTGLAALRRLTPDLAAYLPLFEDMEKQEPSNGLQTSSQESVLLETFSELASLYAEEARLYAELADVVMLEPSSVAWLEAVPRLEALDRSYGRISLRSRVLRDQIDAASP